MGGPSDCLQALEIPISFLTALRANAVLFFFVFGKNDWSGIAMIYEQGISEPRTDWFMRPH